MVRGQSAKVDQLPNDWASALQEELADPYWSRLQAFVAEQRAAHTVFPPREQVFSAFHLTPLAQVRGVILGQDPYHGPGQAHGLCFSVPDGVPKPPSLRKVHRALSEDLKVEAPRSGDLSSWARQGVLLLNTTLTVRQGEPNSHRGRGWERFTDAVVRAVSREHSRPVIFALWGGAARAKKRLFYRSRHRILEAAHPAAQANAADPLLSSHVFSRINEFLEKEQDGEPIDWVASTTA